jgi:hypothetical protein
LQSQYVAAGISAADGNQRSVHDYNPLNRPAQREHIMKIPQIALAALALALTNTATANWEGEAQTRTIDRLTAEEFVNTNPNVAGGRGSASNFYRRAK